MKILHVSNTSNVGSTIAKFMDRTYATQSKVVTRKLDPFDFAIYGEEWNCGPKVYALKCLNECLHADIIHVHSFDKILPYIRIFFRKPIIMHYHGTDIRGKWKEKQKYWKLADWIFYSTDELKNNDTPTFAELLTNPVDTDLFHKRSSIQTTDKTAFHRSYSADDLAIDCANKLGLKLTIWDWQKHPIPQLELPKILLQYEYYIDLKRVGTISDDPNKFVFKGISRIALEALACGLKVVRWDGKILEKFPEESKPENIVRHVHEKYVELLGAG